MRKIKKSIFLTQFIASSEFESSITLHMKISTIKINLEHYFVFVLYLYD